MSELILSGASDPGALMMSILAVKGDPGVTPDLSAYETTAAAQTLANAAVAQAVATVLGTASAAYDTLGELQAILTSDESAAAALTTLVGTKAPILSPVHQPTAINAVGLVVKGLAGQTANLTEWQNSAGALYAKMDQNGVLSANGLNTGGSGSFGGGNFGGTTLSISATAATAVGSIIRGFTGQSADLQQWQNNAGTVLARIDPFGNFGAAAINASYPVTAAMVSAAGVPFLAKGAASQSANLFEARDSANTLLTYIDSTGAINSTKRAFTNGLTSSRPVLATGQPGEVLLAVTGAVSQTSNLQEWRDSNNVLLGSVSKGGDMFATSFWQGASGSGLSNAFFKNLNAGLPAMIVKAMTSQSADLQQWQDSAGTVLAAVTNVGVFTGRAVSATAAGVFDTSVFVQGFAAQSAPLTVVKAGASATGDLMQFLASNSAVRLKVNFDGSIVGSNAASHALGSSTQIANNTLAVYATGTAGVPLILKGVASQSADLQQWQSSTGSLLARIDSFGGLYAAALGSPSGTGSFLTLGDGAALRLTPGSASMVGLFIKAQPSQSANLQEWQDSTGAVLTRMSSAGNLWIGNGGAGPFTLGIADGSITKQSGTGFTMNSGLTALTLQINNNTPGGLVAVFKGAASQSADLMQWQDSAGAVLAKITSNGTIYTAGSGVGSATLLSNDLQWTRAGTNYYTAMTVGGALGFRTSTAGASDTLNLLIQASGTTINPNAQVAASAIQFAVKGSAGQSNDLQQWQDSTGASVALVRLNGKIAHKNMLINLGGSYADPGDRFAMQIAGSYPATFSNTTSYGIQIAPTIVASQASHMSVWSRPVADGAIIVGAATGYYAEAPLTTNGAAFTTTYGFTNTGGYTYAAWLRGQTVLEGFATAVPVAIVKGQAAQSADLQQWQDSAGTVLTKISANGNLWVGNAGAGPNILGIADGTITKQAGSGFTFNTGITSLAYLGIGAAGNGSTPLFVQTGTAGAPVAVIKGAAAQAADLTQWQDSAGSVLAQVTNGGRIITTTTMQATRFAPYNNAAVGFVMAGSNSGATATLTGGGAAAVPLVVQGAASQTADLQQWQDSTATVKAKVGWDGTITAQALNTISTISAFGAFAVYGGNNAVVQATVRGASGQVANIQEWQDSAGTALALITQFGHIFTAAHRIGTNSNYGAHINATSTSIASPVAIFRGASGQTADLQQWQDSAGTVRAAINSSGVVQAAYGLSVAGASYTGAAAAINTGSATNVALILRGITAQTGDLQQWQDSTNVVLTRMSSAGNLWIGNGGAGPFTLGIADGSITKQSGTGFVMNSGLTALSLQVNNNTAGTPVAVFKGAASQTADLTQWQDSAGTVVSRVDSTGRYNSQTAANLGGFTPGLAYLGVGTSGATGVPNAIFKASGSQTADFLQMQNASSVIYSKIKANGEYENAVVGNAASDAGGGTGGIVLKSPDGTRYRVTVANGGTLTVTAA